MATLAGAIMLGGAAVACGQSPAAPSTAGLSGKFRFYVRADVVEQQGQQEVLLPAFKKIAPNVEVVYDVFAAQNSDDTYSAKLLTLFASGSPPDVWGFGQNYML